MAIRNKKAPGRSRNCITILDNNTFSLVESYKSLRTNILFSLPVNQAGSRKVLFTSSNPAEGKSTTCVNTAITLALADMKVLLIDADMRKPTVHRYFKLDNKEGLSNALLGMCKPEECIRRAKDVESLSIVTSGVLPPNPSELLSGTAMEALLEKYSTMFDFIIIDSPPINVVTDALAVSKLADGVVVVAAQNITRTDDVAHAVSSLKFAGANILGFVLNRVRHTTKKYSRGGYKYEYAYSYSSSDKQYIAQGGSGNSSNGDKK